MTWEEKVKMAVLLNDGSYEEAVNELFSSDDIDTQALDMFVTGFDLTKIELLIPHKEEILNFDASELSWRSSFRLITIQEYLKEE
jgi:hypothetical protein